MNTLARQIIFATFMVGSLLWTHSASAQAADPLVGTWKLDVAESKFSPGPPPKSITVTFEPAGEGVKVTADVVGADDKPTHTTYTGNYDGKDYPITAAPSRTRSTGCALERLRTTRSDLSGSP